jgi:hypothetical protein
MFRSSKAARLATKQARNFLQRVMKRETLFEPGDKGFEALTHRD